MANNQRCCCDCATKVESGMPDVITAGFSILTTGGEANLPADVFDGTCGTSNDKFIRWVIDHALITMLPSIVYDYVSSGTGGYCSTCCHLYHSRGDYQPECPEDAEPVFFLVGASPFDQKAVGEDVNIYRFSGTPDDNDWPDEPYEDPACCPVPSDMDCNSTCGVSFNTANGQFQDPLPVYGSSELYICNNGSIVTICQRVALTIPCRITDSDTYNYEPSNLFYQCVNLPGQQGPFITATGEVITCATQSVNINLTAQADLSAVSGATIWEKILNAPAGSWETDYSYAACSCAAGGCAGSLGGWTCTCSISPYSCGCDPVYDVGTTNPCGTTNEPVIGAAIDSECIYSEGTLEMTFAAGI